MTLRQRIQQALREALRLCKANGDHQQRQDDCAVSQEQFWGVSDAERYWPDATAAQLRRYEQEGT